MKLPEFFKSTKKSTPGFSDPGTLTARLAEAENAYQVAQAAVDTTRKALSAKRTDPALQSHNDAVAQAADLATVLDILRDEHAAASAPAAMADRERRLQDAEEEGVALSAADEKGAELIEAELAAWKRLIKARIATQEHYKQRENRLAAYKQACELLEIRPVAVRGSTGARASRESIEALVTGFPTEWQRLLVLRCAEVSGRI